MPFTTIKPGSTPRLASGKLAFAGAAASTAAKAAAKNRSEVLLCAMSDRAETGAAEPTRLSWIIAKTPKPSRPNNLKIGLALPAIHRNTLMPSR
jgi:hypothetical protein